MMAIHPTAIVDKDARIADGVDIGARCIIGPKVCLEKGVRIRENVVIDGETTIGEGTEVGSFTLIGVSSQHAKFMNDSGKVTIGKNNVIQEHVTIHVGTPIDLDNTIVGDNCLIKINAHIAHDCVVGNNVIMENVAALGGHVHVGDHVHIGAMTAFHQYVRVGKYAKIHDMSGGFKDIIPYGVVLGNRGDRLVGINAGEMEEQGFLKEDIKTLEEAYQMLFEHDGTHLERLEKVKRVYGQSALVMDIVNFMSVESKFGYCTPKEGDVDI